MRRRRLPNLSNHAYRFVSTFRRSSHGLGRAIVLDLHSTVQVFRAHGQAVAFRYQQVFFFEQGRDPTKPLQPVVACTSIRRAVEAGMGRLKQK